MNKSFILATFALVAVIATGIFLNVVSADSTGSKDKSKDKGALTANAAPEISTTIVISQVNGGGGGTTGTYQADYVELKNISSSAQSINGLSVMYGSATGQFGSSASNIQALPNTTLQPGQYFLIQLGTVGTGGVPFPVAADLTNTSTNMSGTSGKIALVTSAFTGNTCGATATPCALPSASIIDLVSYGLANNAEGGAATNGGAAITSSQGNVRKTGGCTETDNNNLDFDVITAPVPRNMATAAAPCSAVVAPVQHVLDFNGDGKTDYTVTRGAALTGPGGTIPTQMTWYIYDGVAPEPAGWRFQQWGLTSDRVVPGDYDGDGKSDIAVWRPGASGSAYFYIYQSLTSTVRADNFGQFGDDPSVTRDYTGDGKADPAVYRGGVSPGLQSFWYYRASSGAFNGSIVYEPWGTNGDRPVPGDYDGDGKSDFVIQRDNGAGQSIFWSRLATGTISNTTFGLASDRLVPGDYDGDGKTDFAVVRSVGSNWNWYYKPSSAAAESFRFLGGFGSSATDFLTPGDYDGDGKTDVAVWRPDTDTTTFFYILKTSSGYAQQEWGKSGDYPVANYNVH